jgi:hypothetical protein
MTQGASPRRRAIAWGVLGAAVVFAACPAVAGSAQRSEEEPAQQVYQNTVRSLVIVSYHLKKSDRPYMNGEGPQYGQRSVLQRILNRNALDTVGVILNDRGEIFTFEREPVYRETVDRITVQGPDGTSVPARPGRLLVRAPGRIVQLEGQLPASWRPLAFAEQDEVTPETRLYVATVRADRQYHIYVKPCEYGCAWGGSAEPGPCLQVPGLSTAGVLCNAEGRPVGVTCLSRLDLGPGGPAWRARDILADAGISDDRQKQLEDRIKREFARHLYEIRILPRLEPQDDEESDFGGRYRFRARYSGSDDGEEVLVYGLAVADNRLLVPEALDKELVAKIDTITVQVDGREVAARFGGVLRACAATVIELPDGTLPRVAPFPADGHVPRVEPFWSAFASELAGMDVRTEVGRWVDKGQGYEDRWYPVLEKPVSPGSWLLDRQGRLIGFYGEARYEHTRLEPYLLGSDAGRYRPYPAGMAGRMRRELPGASWHPGYADDLRLFEGSEMTRTLADLPANYDPHIRHLARDEQKRRMWLGVEYTAPDKEMVKQMGLREPTQDGRIGLVVNRVYAGSPAAEMGLAEGDVLLKLAVPGAPWPIELATHEGDGPDMPDFDEADIPKEFAAMGMQMPRRRPWPSQDNYLNQLLGDIGQGTTVKLSYLHGTQTLEKEFTIQQAPRDMLSAAKYKDEKLGLIAKDVTYEVRAALRLKPDEPAVVVTKVERGTPTALARINAFELIRAVDGTPVDNVEALEKLIAQAQEAKKDSVRLTVEWMGKTRLADLKFEARAPAGGLLNSLLPGR